MNKEVNMEGLKINCLYAYGCDTATMLNLNDLFREFFLGSRKDFEKVKSAIGQLDYFQKLTSIAKEKGKDIFSEKVAYEYWFENHTEETIKKITLLKEKAKLQKDVINILLDSTISCAEAIDDGKFKIKRILFEDNHFYFSEDEITINSIMPLDFKKGDLVSVHLGSIREKISEEQARIISESTQNFLKQIV